MPRWTQLVTVALAVFALTFLSGCGEPQPDFISEGRSYDASEALALLGRSDAGDLATTPTESGPELRQQALTGLRRQGGSAARAASVITSTFPASSGSVPYYVEAVRFEGATAWLVLEARGRRGGTLDARWLWVIDEQGKVLLSGVR